jgi:hypothetical protein
MRRYLFGLLLVLTVSLVACNPDTLDGDLTTPDDTGIEIPGTPATPPIDVTPATPPADVTPATPPADLTPATPPVDTTPDDTTPAVPGDGGDLLDDAGEALDDAGQAAGEALDDAGQAAGEALEPLTPDLEPLPGNPAAPTAPQ